MIWLLMAGNIIFWFDLYGDVDMGLYLYGNLGFDLLMASWNVYGWTDCVWSQVLIGTGLGVCVGVLGTV